MHANINFFAYMNIAFDTRFPKKQAVERASFQRI